MDLQSHLIPKKDGSPYQVLLAEDEDISQMMGSRIITDLGGDVTVASNGQEAIDICSKKKFDMIFMDCRMPVLDGFEATIALRKQENSLNQHAYTPIVALTSKVLKKDKARCIEAGMDDYISKPVRSAKICLMMNKWCAHYIDYKTMW